MSGCTVLSIYSRKRQTMSCSREEIGKWNIKKLRCDCPTQWSTGKAGPRTAPTCSRTFHLQPCRRNDVAEEQCWLHLMKVWQLRRISRWEGEGHDTALLLQCISISTFETKGMIRSHLDRIDWLCPQLEQSNHQDHLRHILSRWQTRFGNRASLCADVIF